MKTILTYDIIILFCMWNLKIYIGFLMIFCFKTHKDFNSLWPLQHAEFEWEKQIQSTLLASFFYGYIVTQIPGGYLSDRFGGRRVFGTAMAVACVCTLVMPACARVSVVLVYVLRVLLGLATVRISVLYYL